MHEAVERRCTDRLLDCGCGVSGVLSATHLTSALKHHPPPTAVHHACHARCFMHPHGECASCVGLSVRGKLKLVCR